MAALPEYGPFGGIGDFYEGNNLRRQNMVFVLPLFGNGDECADHVPDFLYHPDSIVVFSEIGPKE